MTEYAQYKLRMPTALKQEIESAADENHRSISNEVISRLEKAPNWPDIAGTPLEKAISDAAASNGLTFKDQVLRDLHFANNPTYALLADIVGSTSIRKSIEESAAQRGVSFDQELLARLNSPSSSPVVDQATAFKVALEYMQARQAFDAREAQVQAIQAAFEESKRAGTATEQDRIDAWNANTELVYLRRAFEGLRERFSALYRTDPRVSRATGELDAKMRSAGDDAAADDPAPKAKRKPKP